MKIVLKFIATFKKIKSTPLSYISPKSKNHLITPEESKYDFA